MDTAYAVIESDPVAMVEERKERALWDNTLMDGLDPNEVWHEDESVAFKGCAHG